MIHILYIEKISYKFAVSNQHNYKLPPLIYFLSLQEKEGRKMSKISDIKFKQFCNNLLIVCNVKLTNISGNIMN